MGIALYRVALGAVIVLGSLAMWLGIPLFWIWLAGRLIDEYPSIYLIALGAAPLTMIIWGWLLYRVHSVYQAAGAERARPPGAQRSVWLGSVSGERRGRRAGGATLLDASMIVSVLIALAAMAVWFFGFARNVGPLPD